MSGHDSHDAGEPHNGRCAFGADCGHATIIDKVDLDSLLAASQADVTRLVAELAESVRALAVSQGRLALALALLGRWVHWFPYTGGELVRVTRAFLAPPTPTASPEPDRASPEAPKEPT